MKSQDIIKEYNLPFYMDLKFMLYPVEVILHRT